MKKRRLFPGQTPGPSSLHFTPIPLATAVVFCLLQTFCVVAAAKGLTAQGIAPVHGSGRELGSWVFFASTLFALAASEWFGVGVFTRAVTAHRDDALDVWRAERFTAIAFSIAAACLVVFALAAGGLVTLKSALTVAGAFSGPLPVLWFSSLGPYYTRPPKHVFETQ